MADARSGRLTPANSSRANLTLKEPFYSNKSGNTGDEQHSTPYTQTPYNPIRIFTNEQDSPITDAAFITSFLALYLPNLAKNAHLETTGIYLASKPDIAIKHLTIQR